jgi:hypothetical protein
VSDPRALAATESGGGLTPVDPWRPDVRVDVVGDEGGELESIERRPVVEAA